MEINYSKDKFCVVAVGSTAFEELIQALDCEQFYNLLENAGYAGILFQTGTGAYQPVNQTKSKLKVEIYKNVILENYIKHSSLVVSHCGAGTLLEALRANATTCVAVVNDSLMGNHQVELADQLDSDGYIVKATPETVLEKVQLVFNKEVRVKKYPEKTEGVLIDLIDDLLLN